MSKLGDLAASSSRLARRLIHTLVGLSFFLMAAVGAFVSFEEWLAHRQAPADDWLRLSVFGGFTVFLVVMGLVSLLRARSVR